MDECKLLQDLFECLGMSHICNRFLSLGYHQLQDVIYLKKEQIESLIGNPDESTKFIQGLYEGESCTASSSFLRREISFSFTSKLTKYFQGKDCFEYDFGAG